MIKINKTFVSKKKDKKWFNKIQPIQMWSFFISLYKNKIKKHQSQLQKNHTILRIFAIG